MQIDRTTDFDLKDALPRRVVLCKVTRYTVLYCGQQYSSLAWFLHILSALSCQITVK